MRPRSQRQDLQVVQIRQMFGVARQTRQGQGRFSRGISVAE